MKSIPDTIKGWPSLRAWVRLVAQRLNGTPRIVRSGSTDSVTATENGLLINVQNFPDTPAAGASGAAAAAVPFAMTFSLNDTDDPILTFASSENTDVYLRGSNDYYAPTASLQDTGTPTGKPSNIEDEIALTKNATNYVYLEAQYDDSSSTEPDDFEIVVYTTEKDLAESLVDTTPTPDEVYQSYGRVLIGTIEVDNQAEPELTGTGLVQFTTTRLFAELFYVSSDSAYLLVP